MLYFTWIKTGPVYKRTGQFDGDQVFWSEDAASCEFTEKGRTVMETVPTTKRIPYIDALKGFAIICVVLGHVAASYLDEPWIYNLYFGSTKSRNFKAKTVKV